MSQTNALIPLAILEAMQGADRLPDGGIDDFFDKSLAQIKFGGSATVAAQITRYADLAERRAAINAGDVAALLRLVSRRSDASLVFADAGRRAGRYAADRASMFSRTVWRLCPGKLRERWGLRLVRRAARGVLGVDVTEHGKASWLDSAGVAGDDLKGRACEMFGAAAAELFRRFTTFDGALFHVACRGTGAECCQWSAHPNEGS